MNVECDLIMKAAREGVDKIIITGPEALEVPLVLLASQVDAWLLDPEENMALCLRFAGEEQERSFVDAPRRVEIDWDGVYALDGAAFAVTTEHPLIGKRVIFGYPLDELRRVIDKAQSFEERFSTLILQDDAIDFSPELVERLHASGWDIEALEDAVKNGGRYSPSRNTIVYPQVFGWSGDGDEQDAA